MKAVYHETAKNVTIALTSLNMVEQEFLNNVASKGDVKGLELIVIPVWLLHD